MQTFLDEQKIHRLYEKYIREYYRYHYKGVLSADSSQVKWKDVHSHNMYQIYTYVKNHDIKSDGSVAGMLLYAKTDEPVKPNDEFAMQGNKFYVRTLDLNVPFEAIKAQLDLIVNSYFKLQ